MATHQRKPTGWATTMVVQICSAGIRRGTLPLSIRGMIPIGIGMILGITATMVGTALGTILGITVAIIGIILIGMAVSITLVVASITAVVACTPATVIQVLLT